MDYPSAAKEHRVRGSRHKASGLVYTGISESDTGFWRIRSQHTDLDPDSSHLLLQNHHKGYTRFLQ